MGFVKDHNKDDDMTLALMTEREWKAIEKKNVKKSGPNDDDDDIVFVDAKKD